MGLSLPISGKVLIFCPFGLLKRRGVSITKERSNRMANRANYVDKQIEQLRKESLPVINKCVSEGFTKKELDFIQGPKCEEVMENGCCKSYAFPEAKWSAGRCPRSTNFRPDLQAVKSKKINPIKQSKQGLWR